MVIITNEILRSGIVSLRDDAGREIQKLIEENKDLILQQLDLFYQGKPVKSIKNE